MTATLPFVQKTFDHFNALCFEGELPPIPIVLTKAGTFLGKVEYKGRRGLFGLVSGNTDFRIKISTCFDLPQEELEDVVIHEMIHYYIAWHNIKDSSTHGKIFRNIMEQLNGRYGRHVTVSHKSKGGQMPARRHKPGRRYLCITTFRNGIRYVTVAADTKVLTLHRLFSRCPDITGIQWYGSTDPFFDRYPRSRTPKVYKITPEEIDVHLQDAETYSCDGRRLIAIK